MHTCVLKQSLTIVEVGISAEFILIMLPNLDFFLNLIPIFQAPLMSLDGHPLSIMESLHSGKGSEKGKSSLKIEPSFNWPPSPTRLKELLMYW